MDPELEETPCLTEGSLLTKSLVGRNVGVYRVMEVGKGNKIL